MIINKFIMSVCIIMVAVSYGYTQEQPQIIQGDQIQCVEQDNNGNTYVVFFDIPIMAPSEYRSLIVFLEQVTEKDTVVFKLITPGGWKVTSIYLFNAILNCKAKTIADISFAYSGGAIVVMACEEVIINTFSEMLIHSVQISGYIEGSIHNTKKTIDQMAKEDESFNRRLFEGFLTPEEMDKLLNGEDIIIKEEDLRFRFKVWKPINIKKR